MARGLQLVFLLLVCALYVEAKSVTCEKKYSKKVTIKDGDSYTYATQSGTNYESKSKCKITYKKHKSCSAMKFSCSAFAIDSPKSNCKGGDKMVVSTSEAKNKKYCQTSGPDVTTTGKSMKVTFTSNGKAQDTGAVCTVECVSDEVTTQAPTEEPTTGLLDPVEISWVFGMTAADICVTPGTQVIFAKSGHNVDELSSESDYDSCTGITNTVPDTGADAGDWTWTAPAGDASYFFVCGVGSHCSSGNMKAKITVSSVC